MQRLYAGPLCKLPCCHPSQSSAISMVHRYDSVGSKGCSSSASVRVAGCGGRQMQHVSGARCLISTASSKSASQPLLNHSHLHCMRQGVEVLLRACRSALHRRHSKRCVLELAQLGVQRNCSKGCSIMHTCQYPCMLTSEALLGGLFLQPCACRESAEMPELQLSIAQYNSLHSKNLFSDSAVMRMM